MSPIPPASTGTTPNDDGVTSRAADATVTAIRAPAIHLVKSAFPTNYAEPGEAIHYTYTVTNTGNVTLHDITLHDDRLGTITCPATTLAPAASTTCQATHVTTTADVDAGHITNTATATGHPPTGPPVTGTDRATVHAIRNPGIQLEKTAFPTDYAEPGETIHYTYTVTNTGNVTLHAITLRDDRLGTITCPGSVDAAGASTLAPGASTTCQATHVTTTADVDAGHITNTATVTGHPPTGPPVTDGAEATVTAIQTPAIHLVKSAFPAEYAEPGETIHYTYTVTNTGNVTLHAVTLHDDRLGTITCPATTLAPAASTTCHATHVTTTADVDAGHITNKATVTGHPPTGPPVTGTDRATVHAIRNPGIQLEKTAFPTEYAEPGETIHYTYAVTNTGNVTLHHVTLTDDRLGTITCPATRLAPGASTTCQATHVTTTADVNAGHITNTATATGDPPTGPPVTGTDRATVRAIRNPGIQLEKTAFPTEYAEPGETIHYTYTVTNTGNVTLHDVTLHDDRLGTITCPATTLAPRRASTTCQATHLTTDGRPGRRPHHQHRHRHRATRRRGPR